MNEKEKARAYDEALKRAQRIKNGEGDWRYSDLIEIGPVLTEIFPQLKESEDEKVRKALIDGVSQIRCKGDITREQMIAYLEKQKAMTAEEHEIVKVNINGIHGLFPPVGDGHYIDEHVALDKTAGEKQKEQKPSINIDQLKSLMLQYLQEASNEKDDSDIEADTDKWARKILGYDFEEKEQKPAEYLNKDKVYAIMKKLHDLSFSQRIPINSDEFKQIGEITKDVRSLLDYPIEQKPAEWSDTKELVFKDICKHLKEEGYNGWVALLEALHSGEFKQTVTEWSEVELEFRGEKVKVKRQFFRDDKGRGYSTTEQDEDVAWNALRAWCEKKGISLYDLYPKQEWSEEDEKMAKEIEEELWYPGDFPDYPSKEESELYDDCQRRLDWFKNKLKSLRPQFNNKEIYQAAKHDLAIKFMNYLDENRPDGKMCLSNGECEDIDKAFKENDWAKIMRYAEKYRPSWKPSEEQMKELERVVNGKALFKKGFIEKLYNDLKKLM